MPDIIFKPIILFFCAFFLLFYIPFDLTKEAWKSFWRKYSQVYRYFFNLPCRVWNSFWNRIRRLWRLSPLKFLGQLLIWLRSPEFDQSSSSLDSDFPQTIYHHPKGFLNPTGTHCFANALFQCLYHLPDFRDLVLNSQNSSNKVLTCLAELFKILKSPSTTDKELHQKKINLIQAVIRNTPEVRYFLRNYIELILNRFRFSLKQAVTVASCSFLL